jgi:small-conductance mechanosensitive channel
LNISQWFQDFLQLTLDFIPHLIVGIIVLAASFLLARPASRWVEKKSTSRIADPAITQLLVNVTQWAVIITGILVALEQVNFNVTGFVAGLGIAGLTIGFALQDITRNFVAGIILMTRKPFKIGDIVTIGSHTGTVLSINTRDTVIKTFDGETVILPNINVFTTAIVNQTDLPQQRRTVRISLGYSEDVSKATQILLEAISDVEGVLKNPPASVLAENLGDSTVSLAVRFWVDQTTHSLLKVHSDVVRAIKETAEKESIDLPHPIQLVKQQGGLDTPAPPNES